MTKCALQEFGIDQQQPPCPLIEREVAYGTSPGSAKVKRKHQALSAGTPMNFDGAAISEGVEQFAWRELVVQDDLKTVKISGQAFLQQLSDRSGIPRSLQARRGFA